MEGEKLPQIIAHRGFKAVYPENTMFAFKGAVETGADAVETDIHLTKDGVVVLSHVSPRGTRTSGEDVLIRPGCGSQTMFWCEQEGH